MKEQFEDIHITDKPDPNQVKAGSRSYTHRFPFPLSAAPPQRWNELLVQEWVCRIMPTPRHIWVANRELVIDCACDELALIVDRVCADIQIVNRKYRHEIEGIRNRSDHDRQKAEEGKRVDDARIRQAIEELQFPE